MLPIDVIAVIAVLVGGCCCVDVLRRLRRPGILPPRDWVVNIEASALALCLSVVLLDVIAHVAAHGAVVPATPFAGST